MIKKIKLLIMLLITMQSYKENLNYASVFAILFQIIFRWLSCRFLSHCECKVISNNLNMQIFWQKNQFIFNFFL